MLQAGLIFDVLHRTGEHIHTHQRFGTGVVELVQHFAFGVQRVGVHHNQAGAQGTVHGNGELQNIRHLNGNAVTGLQTGVVLQIGGKGGTVFVDLPVRQGVVDAGKGRAIGVSAERRFRSLLPRHCIWLNQYDPARRERAFHPRMKLPQKTPYCVICCY